MIEIIDSQIIRDGVNIGVIDGGTAYVIEKQAPRIVGQIRAAAGNPELVVSVMPGDFQAEVDKKVSEIEEKAHANIEDRLIDAIEVGRFAEPEEIGVTVEVPDIETQPEPVKAPVVTSQSLDLTGFPDPKREPSKFRICFVNHYGNDAYNAWQEASSQ